MSAELDHALILERLGDSHEQRLIDALKRLEERVVRIVATAPLDNGRLFDLEWAINARTQIQSVLEQDYLGQVQSIIEGYDEAVDAAKIMLGKYGIFAEVEPEIIRNLKRLSFQGFEAIGVEYLDVLANEVYQNTISGRPIDESIKTIRHAINGVYIESDSAEAEKLVNIAKNGSPEEQEEAIDKLHRYYARDKIGRNLRRYATQMSRDSLMQFNASLTVATGKKIGATKWKYYGSIVQDSRDWCLAHAGRTMTEDQIREEWAENDWQGKAPGDPFIVRGGYNCQHHFRPSIRGQ
jgi:hypothetical protein